MRRRSKPAKAKAEAKLPVARQSRTNEGARVGDLEKRLAEALEQQTATAEILRVISRSPTDLEPVLEAVARTSARLCDAVDATILRVDGAILRAVAHHGSIPLTSELFRERGGLPIERGYVTGCAVLDRQTIHVLDAQSAASEFPASSELARRMGYRTFLAVPLLREGAAVGAIVIRRAERRAFTDPQIKLLETFADQAVIAIENVRLFNETKEALEQQTATAEILRVISSSPTELQPVFDAIAERAMHLCGASSSGVTRFDGELIHIAALANVSPEVAAAARSVFPMPPSPRAATGRAVLTGSLVHIPDIVEDPEYGIAPQVQAAFRSVVSVPMLHQGKAIGAVSVGRPDPGPFSERQISLLQTFADQAVIAIENVRLFNETKEALEQQTATAEILRVIASSPTDLQPVMEAVAESAARLCGADNVVVFRSEDGILRPVAVRGSRPSVELPISRGTPSGRAAVDRETVHVADISTELDEYPEAAPRLAQTGSPRAFLVAPLLRKSEAVGTITIRRDTPGPFTHNQVTLLQTFAAQAVIAIENVRLFNETKEALERQTATSEILRVIASSPTDLQPVFDAIAERGVHLCQGVQGAVGRVDGELIHVVSQHNTSPETEAALQSLYPRPPGRETAMTRAILERTVVHIPDVRQDPEYDRGYASSSAARSALAVPMLRDGSPIGAIAVSRPMPGPFSDNQIELLKTFAAQAVIAIENVRLFNETKEALEQQTATAEILRAISGSPTDVQPVFDTIVDRTLHLCDGLYSGVYRVDGDLVRLVAHNQTGTEAESMLRGGYPRPLSREGLIGRAILERRVIHVKDVQNDPDASEWSRSRSRLLGFRSFLGVPMLLEGRPIGAIRVNRSEPRPFSDREVALLRVFADQAVIAIENVRLFQELQARNEELTGALARQTATSEILQVISRSPTATEPVFEAIVTSASRLLGGTSAVLTIVREGAFHIAAYQIPGAQTEAIREWLRTYPRPLDDESQKARVIRTGQVVNVADAHDDPEPPALLATIRRLPMRGIVMMPMLRDGKGIGCITVARPTVGVFTDVELALLRTFADQAVIAIENVRLFHELEARTAQLTRSVTELRALGEVGQAVSSTLDLEMVLNTIVARAAQLAGADGASIAEYDEATQEFRIRSTHNYDPELVEAVRTMPVRLGEGLAGRAAERREPMQVPDILPERAYQGHLRDLLLRVGHRALLAVPLMREEQVIGALTVNRRTPGEFAPEVIEVLKTFATQSALAIQNARLFREIADKSRQLEAASRHKSEFLANMSHELRTPLNAILGFSEVLAERMFGEVNEKQAEYLQDILSSGRHLLSLINDILDLSKVEAGRLELELGRFHLPTALDNALTLIRERATRHGISLTQTVAEGVGDIVADERKVKQILLNLLSNAVKFTPEGGRIGVTATAAEDVVTIAVRDTGIGIAPEDQAAIFEEFRQVGRDDARTQEGTGLGLTLAKKFVELHGGHIGVQSQVGQGSTFTVTLPVRLDETGASDQRGGELPRP